MEARSTGADGAPEERWQRIRRYAVLAAVTLAALIAPYLLLFGTGGTLDCNPTQAPLGP